MALKPIDDSSLLGDILPNVYISRIILDHRTTGDVGTRGEDPHIDIPLWKPPPAKTGNGPAPYVPPPAWAHTGPGLIEKKTTSSPSGWLKDQAEQAENFNQALFLKVDFLVKDVVENKLISSYLTTDQIKKMLRIVVFVSTQKFTSEQILANNYSFPGDLTKLPGLQGISMTGLDTLEANISSKNISDYTNSAGKKVYDVMFSADIAIKDSNPNHLMVFTHASINRETFENSFSPPVKLIDNPQLSSLLVGKITSEPIFLEGSLVTKASYYEDEDGKMWLGPVSLKYPQEIAGLRPDQIAKLKGSPVKGNIYSMAPMANAGEPLTEVVVDNSIIHDFRVRSQIKQLKIDFSEPQKLFTQDYKQLTKKQFKQNIENEQELFFSSLMTTRNYLNEAKMMFAVDVDNLYSHKSKYGNFWKNVDPVVKATLTSGLVFKSIVLLRRRLKTTGLPNSPSDAFDESQPIEVIAQGTLNENFALTYGMSQGRFGRVDINTPMEESQFKDSMFSNIDAHMWTWFSGLDKTIATKSEGNYQYGVKYIFEDRFANLMNARISSLRKNFSKLKKFYKNSLKSQYYDNIRDSYTQMFKKWESDNYASVFFGTMATFVDLHQMFTGGDFDAKQDMVLNLQTISCPETGNPDGLLLVVELVENFLTLIESITGTKGLDNSSTGKSNTYSPSKISNKHKKNFVQDMYWFKETLESHHHNNMGYEFLKFMQSQDDTVQPTTTVASPNQIAGLSLMTYDGYKDRAKVEVKKYFSSTNVEFDIRVKDWEDVEEIPATPEDEMYSYFAPSFIKATNLGFFPTTPALGSAGGYKINYKILNLYMLEIYKSTLAPRNGAYKVTGNEVTNLSLEEKQEKYQLNQILSLKGVTFVNNKTEGVSLFDKYNVENGVYPILDANLGTGGFISPTGEPQQEKDELPPQPVLPLEIDEINYNDSLFFLADADRTGGSSAFHWFYKKVNKKPTSNQQRLMGFAMPNHYKYLLRLNNPQKQSVANSNGVVPIKNMVDIPTTPQEWSKQYPQSGIKNFAGFGYNEGFQSLDSLEKKFGLWMNFFNLVEVQYFYGFQQGVNQPIFKKLTKQDFVKFREEKKLVLCRLHKYRDMVHDASAAGESPASPVGVFRNLSPPEEPDFKLPIFDEYFLLGTEEHLTKFTGNIDFDNVAKISMLYSKMQQKMNTMSEVPSQYLNTAPSTKQLSQVNQQISQGMGAAGSLGEGKQNAPFGGMSDPSPGGGGGMSGGY